MSNRTAVNTLREVKTAIRQPYNYPRYLIMSDGESLSLEAACENWKQIVWACLSDDWRGVWLVECVDVNWEDPTLFCAHTGKRIPSMYAEDEV